MDTLQTLIIAIVEGLTEFLPVSSTGHMILTTAILGIEPNAFVKFFTVNIQLGAILSVIVLYYKRFFKDIQFYTKLFVGFIPAAVLGVLLNDLIDSWLESPLVVAVSLFLGGIILLFVDKWFEDNEVENPEKNGEITYVKAFVIGTFQCLAMIPGVSRSAATIIGGLYQKLNRKTAAEFSFFLAVPTMFGATAKKVLDFYKEGIQLDSHQIQTLVTGNIIAFIVALVAIKGFIGFLTKHGFKVFGWYRIIVGAIIISMYLGGVSLKLL